MHVNISNAILIWTIAMKTHTPDLAQILHTVSPNLHVNFTEDFHDFLCYKLLLRGQQCSCALVNQICCKLTRLKWQAPSQAFKLLPLFFGGPLIKSMCLHEGDLHTCISCDHDLAITFFLATMHVIGIPLCSIKTMQA